MYNVKNTKNFLFFLITFLPLNFILSSFLLNLNVALINIFFIISVYLQKKKSIFLDDNLKLLFIFSLYLLCNSIVNFNNLEISLKSLLYIRYPILILSIIYVFSSLTNLQKKIFFYLNITLIIILNLDLILQYLTYSNILGFGPGMCGQEFTLDNPKLCTRFSGFFDDELIMGGYLSLISLPIIFFIYKINFLNNIKLILILIFIFYCVFITGERTATLTVFFTILLTLIQYKTSIKIKLSVILLLIIFATSLILSTTHLKARYVDFFVHEFRSNNSISRLDAFNTTPWMLHIRTSAELVKKNPILGSGIKSYRVKCSDVNIKNRIKRVHNACSTHPHNLIAELLVETGIIGTFIFFTFFYLMILKSIKTNKLITKNLYIIGTRSLIFTIIFIPKPIGSIFSSINATMIWYLMGIYMLQFYNSDEKS